MDPNNKLRIATRIHFALLRHYSEDVAVSDLLKSEAAAREALWVCEASGIDELVTLARQLGAVNAEEGRTARTRRAIAPNAAPAARVAATPQDLAWAQDSSGFGMSTPPSFLEPAAPVIPGWLKPSSWLRRVAS